MGTTVAKSPFENIEINEDLKTSPEKTAPEKETTETQTLESTFEGLDFVASGGNSGSASAKEFSDDEIFNFAYSELDKRIEPGQPAANQDNQQTPGQPAKELLPPGMIEISVSMYVQILEGITEGVCQHFGNIDGSYGFGKKNKELYEKIAVKYASFQNIAITPGQIFALMTMYLVFASGFKAWKDRGARVKIESFRKKQRAELRKSPGTQSTLFDTDELEVSFLSRKKYDLDESGKYTTKPSGEYCKKADREKPDTELLVFLSEFNKVHNRWPNNKEVKAAKLT